MYHFILFSMQFFRTLMISISQKKIKCKWLSQFWIFSVRIQKYEWSCRAFAFSLYSHRQTDRPTDRPSVHTCKLTNQHTNSYIHPSIHFILVDGKCSGSRMLIGWKHGMANTLHSSHAIRKCCADDVDMCARMCARVFYLFSPRMYSCIAYIISFECFYLPCQSTKQTTENYNYLHDDFCL